MREGSWSIQKSAWREDGLLSSLRGVDEILEDGAALDAPFDHEALVSICRYVLDFLRSGHPDLGRTGPVCPFAAGAVKNGMLQISLCGHDAVDEQQLLQSLDEIRSLFPPLDETVQLKEELYRAVVVVFPRLPARAGAELIERVQKQLKVQFVSQGLMVGEFYPDCPAPGVHNPHFPALQAPVISIAVRRMTVFDAPFMLDDPSCLDSYLQRFGKDGQERVDALERAAKGRADAASPQGTTAPANDDSKVDVTGSRPDAAPISMPGIEERLEHGFERQARLMPDAVAVEFRGEAISYAELDERASRIASRLVALGVGPEYLVGICMDRGFDLIAGMLGILKAGGAYLPLDPAYPEARLAYMLDNSGAKALLTDMPRAISRSFAGEVCSLSDQVGAAPLAGGDGPAPAEIRGDGRSLAYVIYTSGSTGKPKGVMLEHSAARMMAWAASHYSAEELSRVAAATSICFDPSVFEIFAPLTTGGTILLKDHPREPFLPGERPTMLNSVPSVLSDMADAGQIPPSVVAINVGGEKLSGSLVRKLYERSNVARVFNHYGPTEATTCTTVAHVDRAIATDPDLGTAICGSAIRILRADGSAVSGEEEGEIHIAGPMLARGYVNDAEQTAERFIADPEQPGQRLYRTGDIGRWSGKSVEFIGRTGDFIKLRGLRIAPGEIEAQILRIPGIRQAAVTLAQDPQGNERLVAYIAGPQTGDFTLADVRSQLADWLPRSMLPDWLHKADALPETITGKIDRNALPAISFPAPSVPPQHDTSPIARAVADVIAAELRLAEVGIDDDYFELGGNSLASVNITLTLEQVLGRSVSPAILAHAPTPRLLQDALARDPAAGDLPLIELQGQGEDMPIFCVPDIHGRPLSFISLARELASRHPLYGLTIGPGVSQGGTLTMDVIMGRFMQAIHERRPAGPYMILGYSFGGRFAHELACRLRETGENVGLVLIDAPNTGARHSLTTTWDWVCDAWRRKREGHSRRQTVRAALKKRQAFGAYMLRRQSTALPEWVPTAELGVAQSFLEAARRHVPRDFDGPALIVSCHNQRYINRFLNADGFIGWKRHLTGPRTRVVANVNHHAIVRPPFTSQLAAHLGAFSMTISGLFGA